MDRVHRLGQRRDVSVYRYITARSIEERMIDLQVGAGERWLGVGRWPGHTFGGGALAPARCSCV